MRLNTRDYGLERLSRLLKDGHTIFRRHFPDYTPREADTDSFALFVRSTVNPSRSHNKSFWRWYDEVSRVLKEEIMDDYYTARFNAIKLKGDITLLAPDGYYFVLGELEKIVGELKKIELAKEDIKLLDDTEELVTYYDYQNPTLLICVEDLNEKYIVHKFRSGKTKTIFEFALNNSEGVARTTDFRAGHPTNEPINGSFAEIFKQLVGPGKLKYLPTGHLVLELTPSRLKLNKDPFIITRKQYKKISSHYKMFE